MVNNKDRYSAAELAKKYAKPTTGYSKTANKSMSNSSFWLDKDFAQAKQLSTNLDKGENKAAEFVKLAAYQRAISNFVRIVTGKTDIKVLYSSGRDSYTDSKHVIISARLDERKFDSAVGLALHEASHVLLTDFNARRKFERENKLYDLVTFIQNEYNVTIPVWQAQLQINNLENVIEDRRIDRYVYDKAPGYQGYYQALYDEYFNAKEIDQALQLGMKDDKVSFSDYDFHITNFMNPNRNLNILPGLKDIWNIIDIPKINRLANTSEVIEVACEVFKTIYKHIGAELEKRRKEEEERRRLEEQKRKQKDFKEGNVDKDGGSDEENEQEEVEAPTPQAPAQKKEKQPKKDEELDNVDDNDNLDLPKQVPMTKVEDDSQTEEEEEDGGGEQKPGKGQKGSASDDDDDTDTEEEEDEEGQSKGGAKGNGQSSDDETVEGAQDENSEPGGISAIGEGGTATESGSEAVENEMTQEVNEEAAKELQAKKDKIRKKLEEAIKEQEDFLNGKVDKKKLSKQTANDVNAAADTEATFEAVGGDFRMSDGKMVQLGQTNCLVLRGLSETLIKSNVIKHNCTDPLQTKKSIERYGSRDYVAEGIQLGKLLGKRLQTRDEERSLKTTRLEHGRIDKRLVAELGFGNARVFAQVNHTITNPALVHISVDGSGSMSGSKWHAAMKTAIAIAQAASMCQSLDCIISVRISDDDTPVMWVIYDSRKDSMVSIRERLYAVRPGGSTPEGLCFQAIQKEIIKDSKNRDTYFINICDGAPSFSYKGTSYAGSVAYQHTKQQVDNMRKANISILSYFVSESKQESTYAMIPMKQMYGNDAKFINTNDLTQLSKTLNEMFERKQS